MLKLGLIYLFLFFKLITHGQSNPTCSCEGLVDTEYKGLVNVYDKPNGTVKAQLKHDLKNEDYLVFKIEETLHDYFRMTISYSINGKLVSGWVKKAKYLGTYPRAYSEPLQLYSKPDNTSTVTSIINPEDEKIAQILRCVTGWTYIRIEIKGQIKEGWLSSSDQCTNPYSTCN